MKKYHPDYLREGEKDADKQQKTFWVSFYNISTMYPHVLLMMLDFFLKYMRYKIRNLNSAKIGTLLSVSGTVTRTSEVRPELLLGNFRCMDCNVPAPNIEQQFKVPSSPLIFICFPLSHRTTNLILRVVLRTP